MNDPSDLSAERAALRNALRELEAVAYKGNHRTPAVKEANDRLERIGVCTAAESRSGQPMVHLG
ncbi:hypothetical protein [Streptomyces sp. LN549]|uniref:hypothetical protein n=1 Tax=Streptomyces sp. LN549 TaxID=3112979 RepID=UPI003719D054